MNQSRHLHAKSIAILAVAAVFALAPFVTGVASASTGLTANLGLNTGLTSNTGPALLNGISVQTISQASSGLIKQDSLTTGNTNYWNFGGDATLENAPYSYTEDSTGLHIGVQSASEGQYAGYFAESPNTNGQVFHATMSLPASTIPDGSFNVGLYVQTANGLVNYIACGGGVDQGGYYWQVVVTTGSTNTATNFQTLYYQWMNNQPLTQECQIVTNGANSLTVYLGGKMVFSSNTMNLQIPAPFNTYLEVETTSATQMLFGSFTNYYATTSGTVTVTNAAPDSEIEIVSTSGNVLASANAGLLGGTVTLPIAMYSFPLNANIVEINSLTNLAIGSTPAPVTIWGGDVYTVNL